MNKKIYDDLTNNKIKFYSYDNEQENTNYPLDRSLILSGSFNPLHDGHINLLKASLNEYNKIPLYEISITNVDKSKIVFNDLLKRISQFKSLGKLVITNSPTFEEKVKYLQRVYLSLGMIQLKD